MPRNRQSNRCRRQIRRRADRRMSGLDSSANPAADSVPPNCGGHLADRAPSLDGSSPELAAGRSRAADYRPEHIAAPRTHGGVRLLRSVVCPGLLAHGEHWPDLRRPGARADRQQNQTPRGRSNQGSADQGTSSSARDRPRGTSFSCAARPLPESVNLMDELTTNRLWDTAPKDRPSQYARMILGTPAAPPPRFAPTPDATPT